MDKVIIDGVDVSECEFWKAEDSWGRINACSQRFTRQCECANNSDCYYKQLKRKEIAIDDAYDQIHHLEQECEYLNEYDSRYNDMHAEIDCGEKLISKYKSALEDIRRMSQVRFVSGLNEEADAYNQDMDLIQAKINEVIGAE